MRMVAEKRTAWTLSDDGKELRIYAVDPVTRRLNLVFPLKRSVAMTPAEAEKFVKDNFPDDGAVRAAADTLGLIKR